MRRCKVDLGEMVWSNAQGRQTGHQTTDLLFKMATRHCCTNYLLLKVAQKLHKNWVNIKQIRIITQFINSKGEKYTHTRIADKINRIPGGIFNIVNYDEFINKYYEYVIQKTIFCRVVGQLMQE